jgi:hypothetical protein
MDIHVLRETKGSERSGASIPAIDDALDYLKFGNKVS